MRFPTSVDFVNQIRELQKRMDDVAENIKAQLDKENEMEYEGGLKILVDWRKDKDEVHLNKGKVAKSDFRTICAQFLDAEGYDVTKREPEIKACPVCGGKLNIRNWSDVRAVCTSCQFAITGYEDEQSLIDAINALPRKGE